jgi:hypothetical protein
MTFPYPLSNVELTSISFQDAIAYTEQLMADSEKFSGEEFQLAISNLIASSNGARGFFVSYMTQDWEIGEPQMQAIIAAIKSVPTPSSELLVKNLAMSTAMAIAHRRAGNEEQAQGSDRVAARSTELIQLINLDEVKQIASQMRQSTQTGEGAYAEFLSKWGYDREQKSAMDMALGNAIAA